MIERRFDANLERPGKDHAENGNREQPGDARDGVVDARRDARRARSSTAPITVVVNGATVIAIPIPSTTRRERTSSSTSRRCPGGRSSAKPDRGDRRSDRQREPAAERATSPPDQRDSANMISGKRQQRRARRDRGVALHLNQIHRHEEEARRRAPRTGTGSAGWRA